VDVGVVASADECQICDVGAAAVAPPDHVVCFAPGRRGSTCGDDASAVAGHQGSALGGADGADVSAEVQHRAGGGDQCLLQDGVADVLFQ
jgi:hypothetical protein